MFETRDSGAPSADAPVFGVRRSDRVRDAVAVLDSWAASAVEPAEGVQLLADLNALASMVAARLDDAVLGVADDPVQVCVAHLDLGAGSVPEAGAEEVAAALGVSPLSGIHRVLRARRLRECFPRLSALQRMGAVSHGHVAVLLEVTRSCDPGVQVAVDAAVFPRCASWTPGDIRAEAERVVRVVDPAAARTRSSRALADRRTFLYRNPEGTAAFGALMAPSDAKTCEQVVDRLARAPGPFDPHLDDRGIGARRSDALVELITGQAALPLRMAHAGTLPGVVPARAVAEIAGSLTGSDTGAPNAVTTTPEPPRLGPDVRVRVEIGVVIARDTLLGFNDHEAELVGYGAIPAAQARALAGILGGDPRWRRLVTDPVSGRLLDRAPTRYRPGAALAAFVLARDTMCTHPGCRRRAVAGCEIDHLRPFHHGDPHTGGVTTRGNLAPLCTRHHLLKTFGAWDRIPDPTLDQVRHPDSEGDGPGGGARWSDPDTGRDHDPGYTSAWRSPAGITYPPPRRPLLPRPVIQPAGWSISPGVPPDPDDPPPF